MEKVPAASVWYGSSIPPDCLIDLPPPRPEADRVRHSCGRARVPHADREPTARRVEGEGRLRGHLHRLRALVPRERLPSSDAAHEVGVVDGHDARVSSVEVHQVHSSPLSVRDVVVGDGAVEPERRAHAARHLRANREAKRPHGCRWRRGGQRVEEHRLQAHAGPPVPDQHGGRREPFARQRARRDHAARRAIVDGADAAVAKGGGDAAVAAARGGSEEGPARRDAAPRAQQHHVECDGATCRVGVAAAERVCGRERRGSPSKTADRTPGALLPQQQAPPPARDYPR
mmetsp:Transcript_49699/g.157299  ORF Transcript_49699/g.157299 Transcript_49699/m.157299 type:complete len:287 (+) Transcript_49699:654-1514(+)